MNKKTPTIREENQEIIDNIKNVCRLLRTDIDFALHAIGVPEEDRKKYISCEKELTRKVAIPLANFLNVPMDIFVRTKPESNEKEVGHESGQN